jgi:hypothetical protein
VRRLAGLLAAAAVALAARSPARASPEAVGWEGVPATAELAALRTLAPRRPRGDGGWVLLLHGWGQHARDWETLPEVSALSEAGWTLVAPDMGRSVYARAAPPGVADEPGHARIVAVIDWAVRARGLSANPAQRSVVGVSTGGRGAAILGAEGRFGTVVALSGTHDLGALEQGTGEYRIHAAVFGPRASGAARWAAEDVPRGGAGRGVRWYLGHARGDPHVPVAQTEGYATYLRGLAPAPEVHLRVTPDREHGWAAWNAWMGWARAQGAW